MTGPSDQESRFRDQLDALTPRLRATFALACAERLLPFYSEFCRETGEGEPATALASCDRLWDYLSGEPFAVDVAREAQRCLDLIPPEYGPGSTRAFADDACAALAFAWRSLETSDGYEAMAAGRRTLASIDYHLTTTLDIDDTEALEHPLIHSECARQQRDLFELASSPDRVALRGLRTRAVGESEVLFDLNTVTTGEHPRTALTAPPGLLDLRRRLDALSVEQRASFAAACAERLFPSYEASWRKTGVGDFPSARASLDRLWEHLTGTLTTCDPRAELAGSQGLVPGDDQQGSSSGPTGDACVALAYGWEALTTRDAQAALWAAGAVFEALWGHVVALLRLRPGELRAAVMGHELVQAEVARQERDLALLEAATGTEIIRRLRTLALSESSTLFGS
ncbi:MAG: YjaG family protein [bacterium]|nr:YjaG family protein [bacterium]